MPSDQKRKRKRKEEKKAKRRDKKPTISIAVAGSIIHNAQSLELATLLAGQIARAATIFRIGEVVVFDNKASSDDGSVGLLPPLDAPHHLRKHDWFSEGVTLDVKPTISNGTFVDVGLNKEVLEPEKRVTVAMGVDHDTEFVFASGSRDQIGLYWGYKVGYASNLSSVFNNCLYKGGYDHIIGTSEHSLVVQSSELKIPSFRHLLFVFGGLAGLEESIEVDSNLKEKSVNDVFTSYLNTCLFKVVEPSGLRRPSLFRFNTFKNQ